jgi:hypothetical protein
MDESIYQEIWNADQGAGGAGVPAILKNSTRPESGGFVEVNEIESNRADHSIITSVNIPDDKKETYHLCEQLFNNYTLDPGIREIVTSEESCEETEFIKHILKTPPLQVAKSAIAFSRNQTVSSISDDTLANLIRETWFFQGMSGSKYASGFEHVFVGEQKPKGDKPDHIAVVAGGYHFWYKYYLDDGGHRLDGKGTMKDHIIYGGTKYRGANNTEQGILIPEIVTLSFQWEAPDYTDNDRTKTQLLRKPIGGFWVGCSPECLIALGLVRALPQAAKRAKINGVTYQLDLHPLTDNNRSIRTFFPRFIKADFIDIPPRPDENNSDSDNETTNDSITISEDSGIRLIAALVNPSGNEAGRESITLINTSAKNVDLTNWQIEAPNGNRLRIGDESISAGQCKQLTLPTQNPILRNNAGNIRLLDEQNQLIDQASYSSDQAKREGETIILK